jgi:predicted TIM-barrel fold metal-dependent hydrolase
MKNFETIDADGHVTETPQQLQRYLDEPFKSRPLRYNSPYYPTDGWDRRLFGAIEAVATTVDAWVKLADEHDLSRVVLFPTVGLNVGFLRDPSWAVALCRAYNSMLRAEFTSRDARLAGVALLPVQDPGAAVDELRRARDELGFVAGMLAADGPQLLGHARYDVLFEEAERLGIALCVHGSGSDLGQHGEPFPKFLQAHVVSHVAAQMRQLTSLVLEGVPDRFPRLRLGFFEAGAGWAPPLFARMDREHALRGRVDAPRLQRAPSACLADGNVYFSCESGDPFLGAVVDWLGPRQLLYGSDYPHWDHDFPRSARELAEHPELDEATRRLILSENAARFYGLSGAAR